MKSLRTNSRVFLEQKSSLLGAGWGEEEELGGEEYRDEIEASSAHSHFASISWKA